MPASASLVQAIRAYQRAGTDARAATVALELERRGDLAAGRHTRRVLQSAERRLVRVDVECTAECTLEVDGAEERYRRFYLTAGEAHRLAARFEHGELEDTVAGEPGEERSVTLVAPAPPPAPPPEPPPAAPPVVIAPPPPPAVDAGIGVISPWVFYAAAGIAVAVGGVTIWSAVDTRSAADAFDEMPTLERLDEGEDLERRTNILFGVTLGVVAVAGTLAVFTRWSGEPDEAPPAAVGAAVVPGGAAVSVGGRL